MSAHGTYGAYVNGCRCDSCRVANNVYKRAHYHRNLARSREYERNKHRRYAQARSIGNFDRALIARDAEYRTAVARAEGELAQLVAEQVRDDVSWIRPDLRSAYYEYDDARRHAAYEYGDGDEDA